MSSKKNIKIHNNEFGPGKLMVVAEMSCNHNGSLKNAIKIIKEAKKAGADAVKLQTFKPESITLNSDKSDFSLDHVSVNKWKKFNTFYKIYKKTQTPWEWHKRLFMEGKKIGILIFSSPFDESAVDFLEKLDCPVYKIASPEISHIPLIAKVAKTNKPIFISTGLAEEKDIELAIKTVKKNGKSKIVLMKCNSAYPAPENDANLLNIEYFKSKYNVFVGLSDHTTNNFSSLIATAMGSTVIEKHVRLNDDNKSMDAFFSTKIKDFKKMILDIRRAENVMGDFNYKISEKSKRNIKSRRSIYISKKLKKGQIISKNDIQIVRPGFGLHPKYFDRIVGKKTLRDIDFGERLKKNMIKNFYGK